MDPCIGEGEEAGVEAVGDGWEVGGEEVQGGEVGVVGACTWVVVGCALGLV